MDVIAESKCISRSPLTLMDDVYKFEAIAILDNLYLLIDMRSILKLHNERPLGSIETIEKSSLCLDLNDAFSLAGISNNDGGPNGVQTANNAIGGSSLL
ncbi:hypothetical protein DERP_014367 [Dermatophagoides pteronyssinus]|uniref:Uncharacterized protein n=1 Tax=Dermatophagoides pteronyssinus TaxID=6956 RepID=A0ABQ8IV18_DERPT|nr:hypothetical protein DERP_014367 [Dermatophagoides pteronyssinus]